MPVPGALPIDTADGLVSISPKRHLYVIRVNAAVDSESLMSLPQVKGFHGDTVVSVAPEDRSADPESTGK
jgi:hypothetical protein